MTIFAALLFTFALMLTWYALWGRSWLKSKTWTQGFFAWVEPIEIVLYRKSETILFARLKIVSGLLLAFLTSIGDINLAPIIPLVPAKYQPWVNGAFNLLPLAISFVGWIDEQMRKKVTLPIEVVAVPKKVIEENPKVAAAVDAAVVAKSEAIAVVKEEKAA